MDLSLRKTSKRTIEPVDEWLQNEGYYRKHVPKDPTNLFRSVSEQIYKNQRSHIRVRKECVEFMKENRKMFEEKIAIPYDSYLDQMSCFTEWGSMTEILAMSLLYKRNVIIFHGQKLTKETVIDYGHKDSLYLCFTPPKQYETVFTQEHTTNAGFCQSLVYQTLYKRVFNMNNVDVTVHKMLHERNNHLRHEKFFLEGNLDIRNQLTVELLEKIKENEDCEELQLLSKGITPFPYRVAKALDPDIYRNVDFDIWHEVKKEVRNSGYTKFNSNELQTGARCLVQLDLKENDKVNNNFLTAREEWDNNSKAVAKPKRSEPYLYTGHIQEMNKNHGPVVVFIVELGEKMTVPYDSLKPFPQKKIKQNNWAITANKRNMLAQNSKCKKSWNPNGRRGKEQGLNENNTNKNQINNSKGVNKNVTNKSEWTAETTSENDTVKQLPENYTTFKECSPDVSTENTRPVSENTRITSTETIEENIENKNKNFNINSDINDSTIKHQNVTNFNNVNSSNKQFHSNQHSEKNETFYPTYSNNVYPHSPRYAEDQEIVNYELAKNWDMDGNGVPYSDPATVRHFFNLGVKYYWSQNIWPPGMAEQQYGANTFFIAQAPPDANYNPSIMNGTNLNGENVNQVNINPRHNNRSPQSRPRDKENYNGTKSIGQKSNYRNTEYRNSSTPRDLHQTSNTDMNRNRTDVKNVNFKEHQQHQSYNNKESLRGNKTNGMAPRFKRNYEGRNRIDYHNGQNQYRQQSQQQHHQQQQQHHHQQQQQQQQQQDCDYRGNKKQQHQQQVEPPMIANQCEIADVNQMQQQQQNSVQSQSQQHHPQSQQQPQPAVIQRQTPPPMNNGYSYPLPYNQQVPYIPFNTYPVDSEAFAGHYYPAPGNYVQVPYVPAPTDLSPEVGSPPGCVPIYPAMDGYPAQYPATTMYSQYAYPQPTAPMYQTQPPAPMPAPPTDAACYAPYPGHSYFIPYPPPPAPPMAMACSPNAANASAH